MALSPVLCEPLIGNTSSDLETVFHTERGLLGALQEVYWVFPGTLVCSPSPVQNTLSTCQRLDRLKCVAVALGEEFGVCVSPSHSELLFIECLILKAVFIDFIS